MGTKILIWILFVAVLLVGTVSAADYSECPMMGEYFNEGMINRGMMDMMISSGNMMGSGGIMNMMMGNNIMDSGSINMMGGSRWLWGIVGMLFWIAVLVALILLIIWLYRNIIGKTKSESALEILKKRFAEGKITKKQYESMKKEVNK
ncbi:MAG: hypothetical protein KKD48_04665 [Nanoarchaeota archaeon]|nr:hypothetical protein [Nanoarchaeota archaeon]